MSCAVVSPFWPFSPRYHTQRSCVCSSCKISVSFVQHSHRVCVVHFVLPLLYTLITFVFIARRRPRRHRKVPDSLFEIRVHREIRVQDTPFLCASRPCSRPTVFRLQLWPLQVNPQRSIRPTIIRDCPPYETWTSHTTVQLLRTDPSMASTSKFTLCDMNTRVGPGARRLMRWPRRSIHHRCLPLLDL